MEHPETFAVVGMAAHFSGIVRAPLTGIVLIVEMTGNYSLVFPLLVACLTAYGVADLLADQPVYEALLGARSAEGGGPSRAARNAPSGFHRRAGRRFRGQDGP
jgi:CIC family chloride channel protein